MVHFLSVLSLIFAFTAHSAVVPSGVPSIGLGAASTNTANSAVSLDQLSSSTRQVFSLYAAGNATAGNFYPLYKNGTAYQVTAAKTAYCFNMNPSAATGAIRFQVVSDTAAITFDQSTALTSGSFMGGATARYPLRNSTTANGKQQAPGVFAIGASRYAAVQVSFSDIFEFTMDCFEQ